ncbi:MAG: deoxyribonuclease IV [Oscillospiraceae bacterium]|nr:deoxyribonuclease IV [Oscillospiraceae bacterium]
MYFGCHLSSAAGFAAMGRQALALQADTFQFFTRNPRGGNAKALDPADCAALREILKENRFGPIVAHAPYTVNPCSANPEIRDFALRTMRDDLDRLSHLPEAYYNFHPGSHTGQGLQVGVAQITAALNAVLTPEQRTVVLLETMAGKGTEVGSQFSQLRAILDGVHMPERVGVCLDTCHIYDAGYDLVNSLEDVLASFDREIGLDRLKALHLNDSKNPMASHKDRHEKLGCGSMGFAAFSAMVRHPALGALPAILETPNDLPGYAAEIARLRDANKL